MPGDGTVVVAINTKPATISNTMLYNCGINMSKYYIYNVGCDDT